METVSYRMYTDDFSAWIPFFMLSLFCTVPYSYLAISYTFFIAGMLWHTHPSPVRTCACACVCVYLSVSIQLSLSIYLSHGKSHLLEIYARVMDAPHIKMSTLCERRRNKNRSSMYTMGIEYT